jgi:hypothetical protein
MIVPEQTDIGRHAVYRIDKATPRHGIITAICARCILVRFLREHCSRVVNPLIWIFLKTQNSIESLIEPLPLTILLPSFERSAASGRSRRSTPQPRRRGRPSSLPFSGEGLPRT